MSTPFPVAERAELVRALGAVIEPPSEENAHIFEVLGLGGSPEPADHTDLFVMQLPPYASIYLGTEGMIGGDARDRAAGFWRAVGRVAPPEPDHLGHLMGLWAALMHEEASSEDAHRRSLVHHARATLAAEHLGTWLGPYLLKVGETATVPFRRWAELLSSVLAEERRPADDPVIDPGPLPAEESAAAAFLLTPALSGLIITRNDLKRCAADTGLGLRIGERAFSLGALLTQDRTGVCAWLAEYAHGWSVRLRTAEPGRISSTWPARADATASRLLEP